LLIKLTGNAANGSDCISQPANILIGGAYIAKKHVKWLKCMNVLSKEKNILY
jgi:hypothetical protein